jgi:hypothetical protein
MLWLRQWQLIKEDVGKITVIVLAGVDQYMSYSFTGLGALVVPLNGNAQHGRFNELGSRPYHGESLHAIY